MNRDYIIGFVDGEGCFSIIDHQNYVSFNVTIAQRIDNDRVLFLIQKKLNGIGNMYTIRQRNNSNECNQYCIRNKDDIQYFLDYIGDNDFIKKKDEYDLFRKAFEYYKKHIKHGIKTNKDVYNKLITYKYKLQQLKKFDVNHQNKIL